jgi:hypothetical protein
MPPIQRALHESVSGLWTGQAGFINLGSIPGLDKILRAQLVE